LSAEKKKGGSLSFEEALARLEEILEKMNSGEVPLDESLGLFEEADKLIKQCNQRLNAAEKKIETLIKNRQGDLILDEAGIPAAEPFEPPKES